MLVRALVGLRPTTPQALAGILIEPAMSLPCATGTRPAATAAADPPLEPPGERVRSHGLCVAPKDSGSVVMLDASSGVFVRPQNRNPAARSRVARWESCGARQSRSRSTRMPP